MNLTELKNMSKHYEHEHRVRDIMIFSTLFFILITSSVYAFSWHLLHAFDEAHYALYFSSIIGVTIVLVPNMILFLERRHDAHLHDNHTAFCLSEILTPDVVHTIGLEIRSQDLSAWQLHYVDKFYTYCEQKNYGKALWAVRKLYPPKL